MFKLLESRLRRDWQTKKISLEYLLKTAQEHDYDVRCLTNDSRFVKQIYQIWHPQLQKGMFVFGSNSYPDLSRQASLLSDDKFLTYKVLENYAVPMPKTARFDSVGELFKILKTDFKNVSELVLKPGSDCMGRNVFFAGNNVQMVNHSRLLLEKYGRGLIQERKFGKDVRLQAVGGKLFAACTRVPAHVVGNGRDAIDDLIEAKNKNKIVQNQISIDDKLEEYLVKNGLTLGSVPKEDEFVQLRQASNIAQGGDPIDITETIHQDYFNLVELIASLFSVKTFALDLIALDEKVSFEQGQTNLLEVNAPCIWPHHHFAVGKKRNVALAILDEYFYPESFDVRSERYIII